MKSMTAALFVACVCLPAGGSRGSSIVAPGHRGAATRVVILGVEHSAQLVARRYRPAVFRAFFDRVHPDGIAIERDPVAYARGDYYEFTYEAQYLAVPYAKERGIPVYPIDWVPSKEDQLLGFGVDLEAVPFTRAPSGFRGFTVFTDSASLGQDLFFADGEGSRHEGRTWYEKVPEDRSADLARRLYLYRTFLQARRIAVAAARHRGGTLLVVVGALHKDEIERILAGDPGIEVVQPSSIGRPPDAAVEAQDRVPDLVAVAVFNLLGVQSSTGIVDWRWMDEVVARLRREHAGPETELLGTRLAVLEGSLQTRDAAAAYTRIAARAGSAAFTWTGVADRGRVDSYFDPFGNLTVSERARLEQARELVKAGASERASSIRDALVAELSGIRGRQLLAYWPDYVSALR